MVKYWLSVLLMASFWSRIRLVLNFSKFKRVNKPFGLLLSALRNSIPLITFSLPVPGTLNSQSISYLEVKTISKWVVTRT